MGKLLRVLLFIHNFHLRSRMTRKTLPMLVDENIHYRLSKLLYGSSSAQFAFGQWLSELPLLYGVWHPYKYCVLSVYRCFFPIFALLETTTPEEGRTISGVRRVLHIEKLVLTLLLLRHKIAERARSALVGLGDSPAEDRKRPVWAVS